MHSGLGLLAQKLRKRGCVRALARPCAVGDWGLVTGGAAERLWYELLVF